MDKEKVFFNPVVTRYYSIYDVVAEDFCELWSSKNNASALRTFNHSLAKQLKDGVITSESEYELFHVCDVVAYPGGKLEVLQHCCKVFDTETNNKENE